MHAYILIYLLFYDEGIPVVFYPEGLIPKVVNSFRTLLQFGLETEMLRSIQNFGLPTTLTVNFYDSNR